MPHNPILLDALCCGNRVHPGGVRGRDVAKSERFCRLAVEGEGLQNKLSAKSIAGDPPSVRTYDTRVDAVNGPHAFPRTDA